MPTTSPHGLPYPADSDFVIDGASAIQALAEGTDDALSLALLTAEGYAANDETDWADLPSLSGTALAGTSTPSYRRDRAGVVHLRGGVQNPGVTISTLPVGFRPTGPAYFPVYTFGTSTVEPYVACDTDGALTIPVDSNITQVSLDGVSFPTS